MKINWRIEKSQDITDMHSCIDVTDLVYLLVNLLVRYCTQPEVKFDTLYASNEGKKNW